MGRELDTVGDPVGRELDTVGDPVGDPVGRELDTVGDPVGRELDTVGRRSVLDHVVTCTNNIKVTAIKPKVAFSRIFNNRCSDIYILNETLFDVFEVFLVPNAYVEGNWTSLDMAASSVNIASMFPTSLFSPGSINPPV